MRFAGLGQDDFIAILNANGYVVLSNEYWDLDGVNRIVLGKDGHTFVQKLKKYIFYPEVVHKFLTLNITHIPEEHLDEYAACVKAYHQDLEMRQRWNKQRENPKDGPSSDEKKA